MLRKTDTAPLMFIACLCVVLLAGCSRTSIITRPGQPDYAAVAPVVVPPPVNTTGSIYQAGYAHTWFEDLKARRAAAYRAALASTLAEELTV